jgi:uncharacterized protein DUF4838
MRTPLRFALIVAFVFGSVSAALAAVAGASGSDDLIIAEGGKATATIAVAADAGPQETNAAEDLAAYIEMMSGAKPQIINALPVNGTVIVVGKLAIQSEPALQQALNRVVKKNPVLGTDGIVLRRAGNRLYVAGNNDRSHYYAVAELLEQWGIRWYLPTQFGECVPSEPTLKVGQIDYAYSSPFEVRRYWLSWNGDNTGQMEFMARNKMNELYVPSNHHLATYTKELIPPGKKMFNVPIAEDRTAQHVASQVLDDYKAGKGFSLGMEDGVYQSDSPVDKELIDLQYDKYFLTQSYTDAFMTLYNKVSEILMKEAPESKARIGFLAYNNITLPPVRVKKGAKPLVAYLAPIDIDPNHGMDDPRSAQRREYKDMVYGWSKVMDGRVVIYDYDQGMLVWRDLPNPSHMAFRHDVKHYAKAGILGIDTESRGAMATIFLNLYLRGKLMWKPDTDVDAELNAFYPRFYGPAAEPMEKYWSAIYKAWEDTIVTEHEYFIAPAIYTPELVATLREHLEAAEAAIKPLMGQTGRNEKLYLERMKFTRLSFEVIAEYVAMTQAANSEVDYAKAVAAGLRGLNAREQLTDMSGTFTTYRQMGEDSYAWWPGEVRQYWELLPFTNGEKGTLIAKLPLEWSFARDAEDEGLKVGWHQGKGSPSWEKLRTDLYAQAQGVVTEDGQSFAGHLWYQTEINLTAQQIADNVHLQFPGIFNECWLYVNGVEVAHRPLKVLWWRNDYRFEWDVDLSGKLQSGKNTITVRMNNPHHFGGMFRRPFLYAAK